MGNQQTSPLGAPDRIRMGLVLADAADIEDLGSTNGTTVNGTKILRPTPIEPGDLVALGDVMIEVTFSSLPPRDLNKPHLTTRSGVVECTIRPSAECVSQQIGT